jgi:hypothetical protein
MSEREANGRFLAAVADAKLPEPGPSIRIPAPRRRDDAPHAIHIPPPRRRDAAPLAVHIPPPCRGAALEKEQFRILVAHVSQPQRFI